MVRIVTEEQEGRVRYLEEMSDCEQPVEELCGETVCAEYRLELEDRVYGLKEDLGKAQAELREQALTEAVGLLRVDLEARDVEVRELQDGIVEALKVPDEPVRRDGGPAKELRMATILRTLPKRAE